MTAKTLTGPVHADGVKQGEDSGRNVEPQAEGGLHGDARGGKDRVVILGGGFAGVGAAQKLEHADAEVVLVDRHDYHTFQPLLYQLATGLLETTASATPFATWLDARQHDRPQGDRDGDRPRRAEVSFEELEPIGYDYLVFGLGAEVNFFGPKARRSTPSRCTRCRRGPSQGSRARALGGGRPGSELVEDGALNIVVVGGGPTGVETAGALAELYRADFAADYRDVQQDQARVILVEAGPELFPMFKPKLRDYAAKALEKRTVEVMTGTKVASISPTRVTLESGEVLKAHTLVWGAGLQGNELVQSLALELARGNRIAVGADLQLPGHPEVYVVGDIARSPTRRPARSSPSSGRSRSSRESTPARRSPAASRARRASRSPIATRGRWRRSAVGRRSSRCSAGAR